MKNSKIIYKSKYFKDMGEMDINALLHCLSARIEEYSRNEVIVSQGDSTKYIYIILQGSARSYDIDIEGDKYLISDYRKDSVYGIDYKMRDINKYPEYLIALEDTMVLVCESFRFMSPCVNRCKRHIDFMKQVSLELCNQLYDSKKRIELICTSKTRDKVMKYLLDCKARTKKIYITIPYNRQELADYLGVERTALSAELSKLRDDNKIDFEKNVFKIINKSKNKGL